MVSYCLFQLVSLICKIEPRNALILAILNENLGIIFLSGVVQSAFKVLLKKDDIVPMRSIHVIVRLKSN